MRLAAFALLLALWAGGTTWAGFSLGPGDVTTTNGDQAFDLIAVDLNNPATLAAGIYTATQFNYQFTNFAGYETVGTITPLLLVASGGEYVPIAIGEAVTYAGATSFTSTAFGGTDSFTLSSSTTVYAGLYWDMTGKSTNLEERMPVGYANAGTSWVVYGGGTGAGADAPQIGTAISGTGEGTFGRKYDFSIEVNLVPAPPSLVMALAAAGLLGFGWPIVRRRVGIGLA